MKIWKLSVIDSTSNDWCASTYKGDVIVRAIDEHSARREATRSYAIATERKLGENTVICPWGNRSEFLVNQLSLRFFQQMANWAFCHQVKDKGHKH